MTTKSERGHTPEWLDLNEACCANGRPYRAISFMGENGAREIACLVPGWDEPETVARTALIVRAVNSHEALVKTLQNTAAALDYALGQMAETDLLRPKVAATLNAARDQLDALSLATDKETK